MLISSAFLAEPALLALWILIVNRKSADAVYMVRKFVMPTKPAQTVPSHLPVLTAQLSQSADVMHLATRFVTPSKPAQIVLSHMTVFIFFVQLKQSADVMILAIKFVTPIKQEQTAQTPIPVLPVLLRDLVATAVINVFLAERLVRAPWLLKLQIAIPRDMVATVMGMGNVFLAGRVMPAL